jgi:hypothetical protein
VNWSYHINIVRRLTLSAGDGVKRRSLKIKALTLLHMTG